jgi:amidase
MMVAGVREGIETQSSRADDGFNAFIPGERVRRAPQQAGVLSGLSFAVKDLIDVAGARTGAGNPDWLEEQRPASASAPVVERLLQAGARLEGKTITDELAFSLEGSNFHYGTPVNPACPDRLPGGSSSGSAVAVAAGLVDFSLGTDTGGSVRVPASFVGVFGFRPSHDRSSLVGVVPFAPSYDTVGWFARDAELLEKVGSAILPAAPDAPITKLRIASDAFDLATPEVAEALRNYCRRLQLLEEVTLFAGQEAEWRECYRVMQGVEIWEQLGSWVRSARPIFGGTIEKRFEDAASITASDAAKYRPAREAFAETIRKLTADGTALLLPTTPCEALLKSAGSDEIGDFYSKALTLNSAAGHAGAPQVTIPVSSVSGCPIGLSIIGARGSDARLLRTARELPPGGL